MSLHLGVLVYGMAEGTLNGPAAAQSLMRMISDSSIEEVGGGLQKIDTQKGSLKQKGRGKTQTFFLTHRNVTSSFYFEIAGCLVGCDSSKKNGQPTTCTRNL